MVILVFVQLRLDRIKSHLGLLGIEANVEEGDTGAEGDKEEDNVVGDEEQETDEVDRSDQEEERHQTTT